MLFLRNDSNYNRISDLIIELLQIAIGHRVKLTRSLSVKEWWQLYDIAMKQAVAGISFAGIEKLPKEQCPPQDLLFEWIGMAEQIKQRNAVVDKQTAEIWNRLKEDGLDAAVLKGQGIACEYGELAPLRQTGDIDMWVLGGYQKVCDYVQRMHPTKDVAYHRFHYDAFPDTEVELHHRPTLMRNLFDDRKLEKWYNSFKAEDFAYLEDKGFAVPSSSFNIIFILTHIYRHFLFEGIGLRQVMDYYFVLKNCHTYGTDNTDVLKTLRSLRLERFAGALMWVLHEVFGLEEEKMICPMNEKEGRFVFNEILLTGNFGQADTRYRYKRLFKLRHHISHGRHLLMHYPSEVIWTPIWLVYHKWWKWNKRCKMSEGRSKK